MSVQSISLVFDHSLSEGAARLVLLSIANHDGEGGSWPSIATIARESRKSESTVRRAIKELQDLGELVVHLNDGGTHKTRADRRPNRYEITIDPDADGTSGQQQTGPDHGVSPVTGREEPRGVTHDTPPQDHGVSSPTPRGVTAVTPEPSLTTHNPPSPGKPGAIGCPAHPGGKPNCRRCGTTPRQLAAKAEKAAAERRRTQAVAVAAAERSKPRGRQPDAEPARAAARAALAATRHKVQESLA